MCINIIESFGFILDQELKNKNRTDGQRYHYLPFPQKLAGHKYPEMYIGQSNINQLNTFKFYSLFSDPQSHFILLDVINFSSPLI
jgi:CDP-diacylglycerol pyrophosphatase